MKISEVVRHETFRALLGDQVDAYPGSVPTQYLLDLYQTDLSFGHIYHRVRRFVFECGLTAPANKEDDRFFNVWRNEAFELCRRPVLPLDDNVANTDGTDIHPTDLFYYLRQVSNFMNHTVAKDSPHLPFNWDQYHAKARIFEHQVEDEIDTMWVERPPTLAGVGEWFNLLGVVIEVCLSVTVNDLDERYDQELDDTQTQAIRDVFTWFQKCLDYTTGHLYPVTTVQ